MMTTLSIRRFDYRSGDDWSSIRQWLHNRVTPDLTVEEPVKQILSEVASHGDKALVEYNRKFDCPDFQARQLREDTDVLHQSMTQVHGPDLDIIREAAENIRAFHEKQKDQSWFAPQSDGTILGQMMRPVDRAGLYVPGGKGGETPLISSLLMNAIPAQVAGVAELAVVSPPRRDGTLNPYLLATAALLGITEVYKAGSAWAIAALAYGTGTIAPVDVIAGPGNIFVTTAKRLLIGQVGIDMIAGPSEIVALADASANPAWLAADLLSQAEHDPLASTICIATNSNILDATEKELERQVASLSRNEIAQKALDDWGALILVPDIDHGLDLANRLAPEHFELCIEEPWAHVGKLRHAGAIFMGHHTCEPLGDYFAGPNHVLPTMGTARFSSALSVETFCKKSSIIAASPEYVRRHGEKIARLARLEGLEAHARSMEQRLK